MEPKTVMMGILLLIAITSILIFFSHAHSKDTDKLKCLKGTVADKFIIKSAVTGISYPVRVYLPPEYSTDDSDYGIIYKTDGQWYFEYYAWLLEKYNRKYILVGVEEGPHDRRMTDYLYFGAEKYYRFFTAELIPAIENEYRVDKNNRTLIGASAGGFFSAYSFSMDKGNSPIFRNYLIIDSFLYWARIQQSSIHLPIDYWKNVFSKMNDENPYFNINIILTYSHPDGSEAPTRFFYNDLKEVGFRGLNLWLKGFEITHEEVPGPSFKYALENILTDKNNFIYDDTIRLCSNDRNYLSKK